MSLLFFTLVLPICFVIFRVSKVSKKILIFQSLGVGFVLYVISSAVSFFVYTDALNVLVFLFLYTLAFILSSLINIGFILIRKRKI
ncbi:hypothetical protein SK3146_04839 [Paenibacillus konkukensis]|uniref:Uncharacterized protein n=1 Tax=Paenibacillus konkukensis TaxID=2020716 RepID=A0ABY4RU27_9BACL|nr:hypothetical protein SK3146_04839 [Paenibacillus konkukensis]